MGNGKFIKDSENIAPFNVWSCGDYSHDLTNFQINPDNTNTFITLTNNYSSNGDYGIKLTRLEPSSSYLILHYDWIVTEEDYNRIITFTGDFINNLTGTASLQLFTDRLSYVAIPVNQNNQTVSITVEIPSNTDEVQCVVAFHGDYTGDLFIDNLRINKR